MSPAEISDAQRAELAERFIGYPEPQEFKGKGYSEVQEHNPVLSGIPLAVVSNIICRVGLLQSFLWHNAGFSSLTSIPELKKYPVKYHPLVIPLGPTSPGLVPFAKQHLTPSPFSTGRYYSSADYHAAYLSGSLTPLQVVDTLLPFIAQNQQPKGLYEDAWVTPHDSLHLVLEAAKASTERYAQGKSLGILDGVPIGVKDDVHVQGWTNHWGMNTEMKDNENYEPCEKTAWPALKLQEAGAVVIGKNRMHELGADTSGNNPSQGTPTNHYNNSYYPGGSSSGGGSAISAGIVPLVVGSDAGGSIRIPSANNGLYGLQPSHHRTIAHDGTMARLGPLAATVADLTIAYRIMAQPDPTCSIRSRYAPSQPLRAGARRTIGICEEWWAPADPRVRETCRAAVDHLAAKHGWEVVDISIPFIAEGRVAHAIICLTELVRSARVHGPGRQSAHWLGHLNNLNKVVLGVASQSQTADYVASSSMRELHMRHLAHLFRKHPNLLIVTPTVPVVGWPRVPNDDAYGASDTNLTIRNMMYVWLSNLTGTPSLSAPVGYVDADQGEGKMPVGLMGVGEWGAEETLLEWAGQLEGYLDGVYEGGRRRPKAWFDALKETKSMAGS